MRKKQEQIGSEIDLRSILLLQFKIYNFKHFWFFLHKKADLTDTSTPSISDPRKRLIEYLEQTNSKTLNMQPKRGANSSSR